SSITTTELNQLDGVSSNIQIQIDGKQNTITGAATTITSANLTANRVVISNASGKIAVSSVTATELANLSGSTSNIQAQLDGKLTTLNGLSGAVQIFAVGTTGTDFNISSSGTTHTFNIPNASQTARGLVSTSAQTFRGQK